ncbi:MAG: HAD family hydrolase [Deltaproteobacteria bacterium]|nr:HAD family hydrolase [Deltaproteobacteria bacterium]
MPLEALLLDVDGTLVDSNDAHAQSWVDVLTRAGFQASFDEVRRLIGMGGDKLLPTVTGVSKEEARGRELAEERTRVFMEQYLPRLRAFPDVRPLMERVRSRGVRLVVATSAQEGEAAALAKIAGIDDLLEAKTSSDDADRSKPDPDIVVAALQRVKTTADRAIMLGDTPYDVEAATRAGVPIIAVRSGGWGDADLRGAIAIYDDVRELLRRFDESPLARAR